MPAPAPDVAPQGTPGARRAGLAWLAWASGVAFALAYAALLFLGNP